MGKGLRRSEKRLSSTCKEITEKKKENESEIEPLRKKTAVSEELKIIEKQLSEEREKQNCSLLREKERDDFCNQAAGFRKKIIGSRASLLEKYGFFSNTVSKANQPGTELKFDVQVDTRKHDLF